MIAPTRRAADIAIGEALPPLVRRFTQVDLVAYGAATWDWHRLHYDLAYAQSKKLPGTLVDVDKDRGAVFACVDRGVAFAQVQRPNKGRVPAWQWAAARSS